MRPSSIDDRFGKKRRGDSEVGELFSTVDDFHITTFFHFGAVDEDWPSSSHQTISHLIVNFGFIQIVAVFAFEIDIRESRDGFR